MGDMADLDRDRFNDFVAGVGDPRDGEHYDEGAEMSLLVKMRKEVQDMNRDRDRTFGDDLMAFLERRKRLGKAINFFERWR